MFEKNWSKYLIELLWVAFIIYGVISHLLKRKNIGVKFFLIIEIILVPNLFWYIMNTLIYFYIYVFYLDCRITIFLLCYIHTYGQSQDTPKILVDTNRYLQIPLDASQTLTDTHLFIFLYIWWHTILYRVSIYTYRQTNSGQYNVPPCCLSI